MKSLGCLQGCKFAGETWIVCETFAAWKGIDLTQHDQDATETPTFPSLKGVLTERVLEPLFEDVFCTHYHNIPLPILSILTTMSCSEVRHTGFE